MKVSCRCVGTWAPLLHGDHQLIHHTLTSSSDPLHPAVTSGPITGKYTQSAGGWLTASMSAESCLSSYFSFICSSRSFVEERYRLNQRKWIMKINNGRMIVTTLLAQVVLSAEVVLAVLPVTRGRDETEASDWPFGLVACYWPREEPVNSLRLFRGMTPPLRACWPSFELRA